MVAASQRPQNAAWRPPTCAWSYVGTEATSSPPARCGTLRTVGGGGISEYGVRFPLVGERRSTQRTGRDVFAAAAAAVDPGLAAQIRGETAWRTAYPTHLRQLTEAAAASPNTSIAIARAGLDRTQAIFEYDDGNTVRSVVEAATTTPKTALGTRVVQGTAPRVDRLTIPYQGRTLGGDDLRAVVDDWVGRGIVEPPVRDAVDRLIEHPDWLDLRDTWFGLLGAGAEMAPTDQLLRWGANVVAVDVGQDGIWSRLERDADAASGRLHVPTTQGSAYPLGADLLARTAAIRAWIEGFDRPMVLGNYAYADGETFARLSVGADAVIATLRKQADHGVVCLATPTDVFAVSADVVHDTRRRDPTTWSRMLAPALQRVSGHRLLVPNHRDTVRTAAGDEIGIADSLVLQQGPNYALAKRLQRWRAIDSRAAGAFGVVHVAPPTRTASVVKNRVLAAAYEGASLFGVEIFEPATSRALMAALLVHDLRAYEQDPPAAPCPEHEMTAAAAHGGLWRVAWEPRSALPFSVIKGTPAVLGRRSPSGR